MQKRLLHIYFVAIATMLILQLTSCSQDEISIQSSSPNIQVIGRIPNYNPYYVNTKADDNGKTVEESAIKYMALLTFDTSGKLIDTQQLKGSAAIFVIDRDILIEKATNRDLTESSMYLIANIDQSQAAGWHIEDIDDLKNLVYKTSMTSVGIPSTGIPMIGKIENFNLSPDATIAGDKIQIELELLYAKIEFNLTLNATQIEPQTPSFYVRSCVAYNLPKGVHLVDNVNETTNQTAYFNDVIAEGINIPITGSRELTNMNSLAFTFYMPEHQVNPSNTVTYPDDISESEKQRYKPLFVEDGEGNYSNGKPAYVLINGTYTDHQNQEHLVTYKVYLGSNAIDNFYVERNGRYVNDVTIKGITNSIDAAEGSVSLDHRVNVTRNDFIVFMEREAMLDSHFEVRPIRVRINSDEQGNPKGKVTVEIADDCNWIRLEKKTSAPANDTKYCTNGKRKYFTQGLLSDTILKTECEIDSNSNNCVWVYIDEYIKTIDVSNKSEAEIIEAANAQKKDKRSATVRITYTPYNGGGESEVNYIFTQQCIYPIVSKNRKENDKPYIYYIEYQEEYLHNFDSYDNFGLTNYEGMEWGLDGVQLSNEYPAYYVDPKSKWNPVDNLGEELQGYNYDYYISTEECIEGAQYFPYNGYTFTTRTVAYLKSTNNKIQTLPLDQKPNSAIEYCYNKNKAQNDKTTLNINWYMPSIDELEDIISSAYTEFEVFQEKYYWSSQPAYQYRDLYSLPKGQSDLTIDNLENDNDGKDPIGSFYSDNITRARATRMIYEGTTNSIEQYEPANSGEKSYQVYISHPNGSVSKKELAASIYDEGNKARTELCRVRAIYKPTSK